MQVGEELTGIGPKKCGSEKEKQAAQIIVRYLKEIGCTPVMMEFKFNEFEPPVEPGNTRQEMEELWDIYLVDNWQGGGSQIILCGNATNPRYILVAHYDSAVIWQDQQTYEIYTDRPSPGGNDNVSGSATLLAVTKLAVQRGWIKQDLMAWVPCEEAGLIGSDFLAGKVSPVKGMVSVDQVGYNGGSKSLFAVASTQELADALRAASSLNLTVQVDNSAPEEGMSDDWSWRRRGKPAAMIGWKDEALSGRGICMVQDPNYHIASDDWQHIDEEAIAVFGQWLTRLLEAQ